MARGNLPSNTPIVPRESFVAIDLIYRFLLEFDVDARYLEGRVLRTNSTRVSTTVLADDETLRFSMGALRKYRIQALLFTGGNAKLRHTGPAAPTVVLLRRNLRDSGGSSDALDTAYSGADVALPNVGILQIDGIIHNGVNAGDFIIQWAQNASNATPSGFYAGSVLRYSPVD